MMLSPFRAVQLLTAGLASTALCFGQLAISTHSGLVQFTLGSVFLDDKPLHKTTTNMVEVKPGQVLRTGKDGNAEILLTPGVFMRLGNDSSIRVDANSLSNTKISVLTGSSMVECDELLADNAVSFTLGKDTVQLRKKGLFRLEAEPPAVAAVKGEAVVIADNSNNMVVKQGKLLQLDSESPSPEKFHLNKKDDLYAFSKARSEDSVYATGVTASSLYSTGYTGCNSSGWYPMSGVGMYSYLPCNGAFANPFGFYFLGLNSGYLWNGPGYYVAPYGVYGGRPITAVNGIGGTRPVNPAVLNSLVHGNNHRTAPATAAGGGTATRATPSAPAVRSLAGPALGHAAAMGGAPSGGYHGAPGGGYHGGPVGGAAPRSAPVSPSSAGHASAPHGR